MNIVALDQEGKGIAAVVNGERTQIGSVKDLSLPTGGGIIVADTNVWAVNNGLSQSQYCFVDLADREKYLDYFAGQDYRSVTVSTKYARLQYLKYGQVQADAVESLYSAVEEQIERTGRFDSGKPVRETRGDVSFGMRDMVVQDFLRMQNSGGYESDFLKHATEIAWNVLDRDGKKLFNLKIRTPECTSPNRLAAVLVCTHNPEDGKRREHDGSPWGTRFITRRILCLNGMMQGTGSLSPGSPMRAVLRILGRRWGDKVDREERTQLDNYVKVLVREFQKHPVI